MKALSSHLDAIKELRFEHSRQFNAGDFSRMANLTSKIVRAWSDYEVARENAFMARVCFNCNVKPINEKFSVEYPGKTPMLFCSDNCRLTFGTSLGLT